MVKKTSASRASLKTLAFTSGGLKREEQRGSEIGSALQSKHCPRNTAPETERR
jgi:hypothetical protein